MKSHFFGKELGIALIIKIILLFLMWWFFFKSPNTDPTSLPSFADQILGEPKSHD